MEEITKLLFDYGIGFVIVGLFIYDWIANKTDIKKSLKQTEKALDEISNSSKNTTKTLEILEQNLNDQKNKLLTHDKRCEETLNVSKQIKDILESK